MLPIRVCACPSPSSPHVPTAKQLDQLPSSVSSCHLFPGPSPPAKALALCRSTSDDSITTDKTLVEPSAFLLDQDGAFKLSITDDSVTSSSDKDPAQRALRKAHIYQILDRLHRVTVCTDDILQLLLNAPPPPVDSMTDPTPSSSTAAVAPASTAPSGRLWQASSVAEPFTQTIKEAVEARVQKGKSRPKLVGILATDSGPSIAYAEWTRKACENVGIEFDIWKTWAEDSEGHTQQNEDQLQDLSLEADVEDLIIAANADKHVHGIMVYYPIFGGRRDTYLQQIVDPRKDVEGLHFSYCFNMYHNVRWLSPADVGKAPGTSSETDGASANSELSAAEALPKGYAKSILPCTPLAVVKCMEAMGLYDSNFPYGDRLYGKVITVINRSEVVGRPLAALLANDGARVYSIDIDSIQEFNKRPDTETRSRSEAVRSAREHNASRRLRPHHVVRACSLTAEECIRRSQVVIGGVPSSNYKVKTEWIQEGAACINFSSEKNFEKDVRTRAANYLPAIGKTTIAMLQRNLLRLLEYQDTLAL